MREKMTVSCGNVFEDLGFPPDEAADLQARETLLIALELKLRKRGKAQQELADELGVSRTRISDASSGGTIFESDLLILFNDIRDTKTLYMTTVRNLLIINGKTKIKKRTKSMT